MSSTLDSRDNNESVCNSGCIQEEELQLNAFKFT